MHHTHTQAGVGKHGSSTQLGETDYHIVTHTQHVDTTHITHTHQCGLVSQVFRCCHAMTIEELRERRDGHRSHDRGAAFLVAAGKPKEITNGFVFLDNCAVNAAQQ